MTANLLQPKVLLDNKHLQEGVFSLSALHEMGMGWCCVDIYIEILGSFARAKLATAWRYKLLPLYCH